PAVRVCPDPELREPEGKRQRRVAQRAGERVAQLARAGLALQLNEQLADIGSRQPRSEQADQEGNRCDADRDEGDPPNGLEGVPLTVALDQQQGPHHQAEREQVQQKRGVWAGELTVPPPPPAEPPPPAASDRSDGQYKDD